MARLLRIGFVPEHFSTPLYFAAKYFSLNATLIPFPSGTGHMVTSLRSKEIDVGIGLTEGWVAALAKAQQAHPGSGKGDFKLIGTYVDSPLCWAISTGANREIEKVEKGCKCGVSRLGSGSHIMSYVLADQNNWLSSDPSSSSSASTPPEDPFTYVPLQTFAKLRDAVKSVEADFFMWEYFTSKRYYDNASIRKIGEIYTPWSSWKIVANDDVLDDARELQDVLQKINQGIRYFGEHPDEAVRYISSELDYSEDDAREWLTTVRFPEEVRIVKARTVENVVDVLRKAGVLGVEDVSVGELVAGSSLK